MRRTGSSTAATLQESAELPLRMDTRWGLGEIVDMAVFFVTCWLIIGVMLVMAVVVGHGWLLMLGLVFGTATGVYPAILFRRDARLAESALRAVTAEVSEQGLAHACSMEPRLQPAADPRQKRPRRQL
jgi:hypothetical protein